MNATRFLFAPVALLSLAGCPHAGGPSNSAERAIDAMLAGSWKDEGGTEHTITATRSGARVVSIVDYDREVFTVLASGWTDAGFTWTYNVPSTGYEVTMRVDDMPDPNTLSVSWSNVAPDGSRGAGTEIATRQ